jgi:hypothetical protein
VVARMAGLIRQVEQQAAQLESLAQHDPLTGAANRRAWDRAPCRPQPWGRRCRSWTGFAWRPPWPRPSRPAWRCGTATRPPTSSSPARRQGPLPGQGGRPQPSAPSRRLARSEPAAPGLYWNGGASSGRPSDDLTLRGAAARLGDHGAATKSTLFQKGQKVVKYPYEPRGVVMDGVAKGSSTSLFTAHLQTQGWRRSGQPGSRPATAG